MANYKDLIVFQKADELAFQVYKLTEKFPKAEMFGLTSQIRRAAVSIPTNIVEGREQRMHKMGPSPDRWKNRSRTYLGIAEAMSIQWG